jgi:hypothetical protein
MNAISRLSRHRILGQGTESASVIKSLGTFHYNQLHNLRQIQTTTMIAVFQIRCPLNSSPRLCRGLFGELLKLK